MNLELLTQKKYLLPRNIVLGKMKQLVLHYRPARAMQETENSTSPEAKDLAHHQAHIFIYFKSASCCFGSVSNTFSQHSLLGN